MLFVRLQRGESLLYKLSPEVLFVTRGELGVAGHMHDAGAQHDSIRAHHFCDGQRRGNLHHGDAGFFELSGDRSAAASARASRGR